MKKIIIFIIILTLSFNLTSTVEAAFWSKWFKSDKEPANEQVQTAPPTSFWTRIIRIIKPTIQPTPPPTPVVNTIDVLERTDTIEKIVLGKYYGDKDISISFSKDEITNVILPRLNQKITQYNKTGNKATVNGIYLLNNTLVANVTIVKPLTGIVYVSIQPSVHQGKLKVVIQKIKYKGFPIPQLLINKILKSFKINPEQLIFSIPNFNLEKLEITPKTVLIQGKSVK